MENTDFSFKATFTLHVLVLISYDDGWFTSIKPHILSNKHSLKISGLTRAFPGGRVAHPKGQNEEENDKDLRKIKNN